MSSFERRPLKPGAVPLPPQVDHEREEIAAALAAHAERQRQQAAQLLASIPASFVAFCAWLGVTLTPGQAEFARVAFDGGNPEGDIGRSLFGDVAEVPPIARGVIAAVCGARSGKSYVMIAMRLLHAMLVSDLSTLAPGQLAVSLIIAPNNSLRSEVFNYALGAVQAKPELAGMLVEERGDDFVLRRPDGQRVGFATGVATRGGYAARGRSLTAFALDETAFLRDASFKVCDLDLFRAGSARVLPGGQTIVVSTPWAQSGLLYDMYRENWGHPRTALVAHAPTLLMNPSDFTRALVEREYARDAESAAREFGAEFLASGTSDFFPVDLIEACVDVAAA